MREIELAVIGGGPAGISAAIEAAKLGVQVAIIDENSKVGGAIYKQFPDPFIVGDISRLGKDYIRGQKMIEEFDRYRGKIEFLESAVVWGLFEDKSIEINYRGKNQTLKPLRLIIAEGAYERPMPFPGWTLPGVFAAGGLHTFIKTQQILPGERFLVTGTGPCQLAVATQLIRSGAKVVGVLEASSSRGIWNYLSKMLGQWGPINDGLQYLNELRKAKVPFLNPYAIVEARGGNQVAEAIYAKVDKDWRPVSGTEKVVEVDSICIGYGFVPSIRLSGLSGCRHQYHRKRGGWIPEHDSYMETSVPGVFVVGDGAGVAGVLVAVEEARLCSIRVCHQLGRIREDEADRLYVPIFEKLKKIKKIRTALEEFSVIRPGWFTRLKDDTIVCRCEEVTAGEIQKLIADGATSINQIKLVTRTGMGHCQGRICESSLSALVAIETKKPIEEVGRFITRPPVRPISLGELVAE